MRKEKRTAGERRHKRTASKTYTETSKHTRTEVLVSFCIIADGATGAEIRLTNRRMISLQMVDEPVDGRTKPLLESHNRDKKRDTSIWKNRRKERAFNGFFRPPAEN